MINSNAIFTDETIQFKTPYEPKTGDRVTLTLRTLKNDVLRAYAVINGIKHSMSKVRTKANFDYWEASFICPQKEVRYYFTVSDDDDMLCYNRLGCAENHQAEYCFSFIPDSSVPEWARSAVYYQIFPDRFFNGNKDNDVVDNEYFYTGGHSHKVADWNAYPAKLDVNNFYGGDLQGVQQKLDYLQGLGVDVIYLNPVFVSPSNHKYDAQDYDHIDPHLAVIEDDGGRVMEDWEKHNGFAEKYIKRVTSQKNLTKSDKFFAKLVEDIHARGMKVILDGVFNHCGSFHKWIDKEGIYLNKKGYEKGAFQSVQSPYRNYFKFDRPSRTHSGYEGWWGHATLPKLNYEHSEQLEEEVLKIAEKWVSPPFNCDGWRLDVAADLGHSPRYNHKFWAKFRDRVRKANPNALVFAEHYGSPESWLKNGEWDSVMNYDAFMEPVTWFLTGMDKHSDSFDGYKYRNGRAFFEIMTKNMSKFSRPALECALNQLSNHDHSRFLTRTNRTVGRTSTLGPHAAGENVDVRVMQLAVLIQMTWVGAPGIYYADEAGQVGWTDPDSRRTYPWGHEDKQLIEFHRAAVRMRKKLSCLSSGSIIQLDAGNGYIAYGRFDKEGGCVIIINVNDGPVSLLVPVWQVGVPRENAEMTCIFRSSGLLFSEEKEKFPVRHGRLSLNIPECSGIVLHYSDKND